MFAMPNEFQRTLIEVIHKNDLVMVREPERSEERLETLEFPISTDSQNRRIYLAQNIPYDEFENAKQVLPLKWGWVSCSLPFLENNILFKSEFVAKSDWYDGSKREFHENRGCFEILNMVRKEFRKTLRRPTWARNIRSKGKVVEYRDTAYTEGARLWEAGGGELMQYGVKYVRYYIEKPVTD